MATSSPLDSDSQPNAPCPAGKKRASPRRSIRARATGSGLPVRSARRMPPASTIGERFGRAGRRPPGRRVGDGQKLQVATGEGPAPDGQALVDLVVVETGVAQDEAGDPQARLPRVVDSRHGVRRQPHRIEGLESRHQRLAGERVVREEQRAVDVEEREQRHQMPSRSSIASSRRHFGLALTLRSRKIWCPSRSSISGRARVPICLTIGAALADDDLLLRLGLDEDRRRG